MNIDKSNAEIMFDSCYNPVTIRTEKLESFKQFIKQSTLNFTYEIKGDLTTITLSKKLKTK